VFDMAPTVAALLDLPVDRRVGGSVIRAGFSEIGTPARKDLFGTVAVRRLAEGTMSEKEANEFAQRLRSLGYLSGGEPAKLEPTGGDRPGLTEGGWNNLGLYLRENTKDLARAESAFQKALALRPAYASPVFNLAILYRERGEDHKALDWLFRSLEAGHADPEGTILHWFIEYQDKGKHAEARSVLERGLRAYPANEDMARELAILRFKAKDCVGAWDTVARFEPTSQTPDTINALALFKTCLGRRDEAVALFEKSLAIKPEQPGVVQSLNLLKKGPPPGH
jgi:tetratricopeptide (TPR) repeat protein